MVIRFEFTLPRIGVKEASAVGVVDVAVNVMVAAMVVTETSKIEEDLTMTVGIKTEVAGMAVTEDTEIVASATVTAKVVAAAAAAVSRIETLMIVAVIVIISAEVVVALTTTGAVAVVDSTTAAKDAKTLVADMEVAINNETVHQRRTSSI